MLLLEFCGFHGSGTFGAEFFFLPLGAELALRFTRDKALSPGGGGAGRTGIFLALLEEEEETGGGGDSVGFGGGVDD